MGNGNATTMANNLISTGAIQRIPSYLIKKKPNKVGQLPAEEQIDLALLDNFWIITIKPQKIRNYAKG